jgi:hypothetical protein
MCNAGARSASAGRKPAPVSLDARLMPEITKP